MGMDLHASRRSFCWNNRCWRELLKVGWKHGWEPSGTGPCKGSLKKDWDGTGLYFSNDGQLFYARDAKNLANALESFLDASRQIKPSKTKRVDADECPSYFFSANGRKEIKLFIVFCRKGSFRIY